MEKPTIKDLSSSRSRSRKSIRTYKKSVNQHLYKDLYTNMDEQFKALINQDLGKPYKHMKSNSEAVRNQFNKFEDSRSEAAHYENLKGIAQPQISPEKPVFIAQGEHGSDQNMVILPNDINSVKYPNRGPYQRREPGIYSKLLRQRSFGQIPEEGCNPYVNINPYENEEKISADFNVKD